MYPVPSRVIGKPPGRGFQPGGGVQSSAGGSESEGGGQLDGGCSAWPHRAPSAPTWGACYFSNYLLPQTDQSADAAMLFLGS